MDTALEFGIGHFSRMVCFDTFGFLSIAKRRRIDDSETDGIDVVDM